MAWELCTREDVIKLHPFPIDELEDDWSEYAEQLVRREMGTPNLGTSAILTNETHNGDGTPVLVVREPPIISVQEIRISGIAVTSSDYVVFQNYVKLIAQNFPEGNLNVQIDYTSGDTTVDPIVKLTTVALIAAMINYYKRYGADASFQWGIPDQTEGGDTPNRNVGLTSHLRRILKAMLRRERIRVS